MIHRLIIIRMYLRHGRNDFLNLHCSYQALHFSSKILGSEKGVVVWNGKACFHM